MTSALELRHYSHDDLSEIRQTLIDVHADVHADRMADDYEARAAIKEFVGSGRKAPQTDADQAQ